MDKLEHYLDRVCRSIGGPRSLRQHVRQELREHLRDAAAEYKTAGLSEEAALDRALDDFGGPEEVRAELEATHGHRLLPVVIDKAMQWQEMTMKAKWLWTTWAYLAIAGVVAVEITWISFTTVFLTPKFKRLMLDGLIDPAVLNEHGMNWMPAFLDAMSSLGNHTALLLLLAASAWGLFEWRVRSDNKPFMRLSALGTAGIGLAAAAGLMAACLVIPYMLAAPPLVQLARPFAVAQIASIDTSIHELEQAMDRKDWDAMRNDTDHAVQATGKLAIGGVAFALEMSPQGRVSVGQVREQLESLNDALVDVQQAIRDKDANRLKAAVEKLRHTVQPLREAARASGN